ncbi:MAG: biotin/lipoyl-binding protein, partial [Dehalococcoidales bacterium]
MALVLVGTLAAGCSRDGDAEDEPAYKLVPVTRGDISVEVTSSGSLAYSTKEQLSFGVAGTVDQVFVEEGDTVPEGQVLASLDGASVIAMERAVSLARIDLRNAEDNLKAVRNPYTESDVALAELAVTSAELALQAAVDNLGQVENPYTESDILEAELAVMSAEAALDAAETAFDLAEERLARNPSYQPWKTDLERKGKLFDLAGYDLIAAEDALVEIEAGADPLLVEQKQEQVIAAEASLAEAEDALEEMLADADPLLEELRQVDLAIARATLDDALADLELYAIVAP